MDASNNALVVREVIIGVSLDLRLDLLDRGLLPVKGCAFVVHEVCSGFSLDPLIDFVDERLDGDFVVVRKRRGLQIPIPRREGGSPNALTVHSCKVK